VTPALQTIGLSRRFGALQVARDVDFVLPQGARHALIGPNGAGKTTFINMLTGGLAASSGSILLAGEDISTLRPDQRVKRGLVRTFQVTSLFPALTPMESVTLAVFEQLGLTTRWLRRTGAHAAAMDEAAELLSEVRLAHVARQRTDTLPYGQQRILEVALALALKPRVLLLDEPAAGMGAADADEMFRIIDALPQDMSVLFIEHDMHLVFRFATRISVMVAGALLVEGTPAEIAGHPEVRAVYLGGVGPAA